MSRSCQSRSCCLLNVLEIVINSVMDPTFHMTISYKEDILSVQRSAKLINCFVDKIEPTLVSLSLCMRVQNREEFVKLGEILRNSTGSLKQLCLTIEANPYRFSPISLLGPVAENKTL